MANKENPEEIANLLEKLCNVHYTAGPIHQSAKIFKAQNCIKNNELEAIYHLVESHVPSLRMKTVLRYEKILTSQSNNLPLSLSKNHVALNCTNSKITDNVKEMLDKIQQMPSEWTLVQLTPHLNPEENVKLDMNKHYTNPLFLTVFNCGENQPKPFCVSIEAPRDAVTGAVVPLVQEIHSIIQDSKQNLGFAKAKYFADVPEKQNYFTKRQLIDDRLKMLVKDLQDLYLKEWKCFMIGKYINKDLECKISKSIVDFFKTNAPSFNLEEKTRSILHYIVKGADYLTLTELRRAIQTVIPGTTNKNTQKQVAQFVRDLSAELKLSQQKRHPLILIIDNSLDSFPWEMMDILVDVPVSRLPSLHLAYALFQEHKDKIIDGFKIVENVENGKYVINPDLDLRNMQNRILSFYEYWLPKWTGIAGAKPTEDEFEKLLLSGDIFAYNGHGSGTHFFPMHRIEKIRISAVVLLFGCSSTKLNIVGPQTEMCSPYQMYLIACSPCIIGNLWEVTDLDTDTLATELLSLWIPNHAKVHWRHLDKTKWKKGEIVNFRSDEGQPLSSAHEPELLKALSTSKKSNLLRFYITKAGIVARGIPIKIATK